LTVLTVIYLNCYTNETSKLRIATRDQVEVNNQILGETIKLRKATQEQVSATNLLLEEERKQTEAARSEIEVTKRVLAQATLQNRLNLMPIVVMSTGRNTYGAETFTWRNMGKGAALNVRTMGYRLNDTPESIDFSHPRAIAPGDIEFGVAKNGSKEIMPNEVSRIMSYEDNCKEAEIAVSYCGSDRRRFETRHKLRSARAALDIEFVSFDEIA
jgi:hypothetical protein